MVTGLKYERLFAIEGRMHTMRYVWFMDRSLQDDTVELINMIPSLHSNSYIVNDGFAACTSACPAYTFSNRYYIVRINFPLMAMNFPL